MASPGQIEREVERALKAGWELMRARQVPVRASYRVQLDPRACKFTDAGRLVAYLDALGISHLYASPHLKPRPGSTHGYDVVDHTAINLELGTEDELTALHA